jgi:hypothetical protein
MENIDLSRVCKGCTGSDGRPDNKHAGWCASAAVRRHGKREAEFVALDGVGGGKGLNVAPSVRGCVPLLHERGMPVVLENVDFATCSGRPRRAHCCESASAIDGDRGAEQVASAERRGWGEELQKNEEVHKAAAKAWCVLVVVRKMAVNEWGNERKLRTFWRLREKSLTAAKAGRGSRTRRRRRRRR